MNYTRRIIILAIFVAQALILSIIESLLPGIPIPVPGVKLGLANIITVVVIVFFGFRSALAVVVIRIILSSMYGGGFVVFLFSVSGGIFSTIAMSILFLKFGKTFSITGISIVGAIMHNVGQLLMASFVMQDMAIMSYLPVLMISGVVMGFFVGITGYFLIDRLKKSRILTM